MGYIIQLSKSLDCGSLHLTKNAWRVIMEDKNLTCQSKYSTYSSAYHSSNIKTPGRRAHELAQRAEGLAEEAW